MMSCAVGGKGRRELSKKNAIFHKRGVKGLRQKVIFHDNGGRGGQAKSDFV